MLKAFNNGGEWMVKKALSALWVYTGQKAWKESETETTFSLSQMQEDFHLEKRIQQEAARADLV
jgi:hypothetical protein